MTKTIQVPTVPVVRALGYAAEQAGRRSVPAISQCCSASGRGANSKTPGVLDLKKNIA